MANLSKAEYDKYMENTFVSHFNGKDAWLTERYKKNPNKLFVYESITSENLANLVEWHKKLRTKGLTLQKVVIEKEIAFEFPVFSITVYVLDCECRRLKVFKNIPNKV